jgi:hypothetical protein
MNPIDEDKPTDVDQFDLLVDGELSESQRRELLLRLDGEPGGWRRCALAFLTAQSWKQELGSIVSEKNAPTKASGRPSRPWSRFGGYAGTLLAMAASFLIALVLGQQLQNTSVVEAPLEAPSIGDLATNEGAAMKPDEVQPPQQQPGQATQIDPTEVFLVELPGVRSADGQIQPPIRLPAVEHNENGLRWLESLPASIPPELLDQWQRDGLRVEQHRELVPLQTNDGRPLVVPIDRVNIRYVGNPTL